MAAGSGIWLAAQLAFHGGSTDPWGQTQGLMRDQQNDGSLGGWGHEKNRHALLSVDQGELHVQT